MWTDTRFTTASCNTRCCSISSNGNSSTARRACAGTPPTGWAATCNRLWVTSEGEAIDGSVGEAELKVLFGRAFSRWWEVVGGVRQDIRPSPSHTWFAVGVHGLAPHWFEIDANLYVGSAGHTAARIEAEYEVLVTNRLVLQPLVELSLSGKDDPDRGIGAGLEPAKWASTSLGSDAKSRRMWACVASEGVRHCRLRQGRRRTSAAGTWYTARCALSTAEFGHARH